MDIRHLATFATVLRARTFLATSRVLGYSQSTVTLHIQELERELGVTLFHRTGKRLELTEAGSHLETRSRQILDALSDLTRDMASLAEGRSGTVRLGAVEPIAHVRLPTVLARLCADCPELRVRLEVAGSGTIARRVIAGELDFGIATPPEHDAPLTFEPLFVETLVLAIPGGTPLAKQRSVRAADLQSVRVVLTDQGCAYRRTLQEAFSRAGLKLQIAHEMGSIAAVLNSARAGLGVGVVPRSAIPRDLRGVVVRYLSDTELGVAIGVLLRSRIALPSRAVALVLAQIRHGLQAAAKPAQRRA